MTAGRGGRFIYTLHKGKRKAQEQNTEWKGSGRGAIGKEGRRRGKRGEGARGKLGCVGRGAHRQEAVATHAQDAAHATSDGARNSVLDGGAELGHLLHDTPGVAAAGSCLQGGTLLLAEPFNGGDGSLRPLAGVGDDAGREDGGLLPEAFGRLGLAHVQQAHVLLDLELGVDGDSWGLLSAAWHLQSLGLGTTACECEGKHEPLDLGQGGGLRGVHDPDVDPALLVVAPNELHVGADAGCVWRDLPHQGVKLGL